MALSTSKNSRSQTEFYALYKGAIVSESNNSTARAQSVTSRNQFASENSTQPLTITVYIKTRR